MSFRGHRRAVGEALTLGASEYTWPRFAASVPVDPAEVGARYAGAILSALAEHGAVSLRGLGLSGAPAFEAFTRAVTPELHAGYPELPGLGAASYRATQYPPELEIAFHNEAAHRARWPQRQWFFSEVVAEEGGRTSLADGRRVISELGPLAAELERRGLRYSRCFDPRRERDYLGDAAVEEALRAEGARWQWHGDTVSTWVTRPAFVAHPMTGERFPFHQLLVHHPSTLPEAARAALSGRDPLQYPRNVTWGDGAPIAEEVVSKILAAYRRAAAPIAWMPGDLLLFDNVRMAHAREPFRGPRRMQVTLASMAAWP